MVRERHCDDWLQSNMGELVVCERGCMLGEGQQQRGNVVTVEKDG